jgi:hypothetical protein
MLKSAVDAFPPAAFGRTRIDSGRVWRCDRRLCYIARQPPVNGTSPEQSWDYQARFEAPKNILKDYSMPLLSSHPVYRQECRSVHGKSDSKPICLHANK